MATKTQSIMTVGEIMQQLEEWGNESTKRVLVKHGAKEPFFGVKVADLKKIQKKVKKDYQLALDLYRTGNSDAMYLAGLIADETKMTREDLQNWADQAYWYYINEYTVPWITSETPYAFEMALKWIEEDSERHEAAGWATIASFVSVRPNEEIDMELISRLLDRIEKEIHQAKNRVRHVMNGFVITVASYLSPLSAKAIAMSERIGKVYVEMGGTACKVPYGPEYIPKVIKRGTLDRKRKEARC